MDLGCLLITAGWFVCLQLLSPLLVLLWLLGFVCEFDADCVFLIK